jgi:hypothetical protein
MSDITEDADSDLKTGLDQYCSFWTDRRSKLKTCWANVVLDYYYGDSVSTIARKRGIPNSTVYGKLVVSVSKVIDAKFAIFEQDL